MSEARCLYCYMPLADTQVDYHPTCSKKIFGTPIAPLLEYKEADIEALAWQVVKTHVAIPGVQQKLSLHLVKETDTVKRFTIVGLWGGYILKPPTKHYTYLPEIEDLTMHLAELSSIATVQHSLIRMQGGNLAYITKRIDRKGKAKLHMEDMCQLTERLTEHKYNGSYEQIAKAILNYSSNPGYDVVNFYEQVMFSFLTGNADMHLKNFSLLKNIDKQYNLCPAYDMVATALIVQNDNEDLALTLNGRKRKIVRNDFIVAMRSAGINNKAMTNIFQKFERAIPKWIAFIGSSFVPANMQASYIDLIQRQAKRLEIETEER